MLRHQSGARREMNAGNDATGRGAANGSRRGAAGVGGELPSRRVSIDLL